MGFVTLAKLVAGAWQVMVETYMTVSTKHECLFGGVLIPEPYCLGSIFWGCNMGVSINWGSLYGRYYDFGSMFGPLLVETTILNANSGGSSCFFQNFAKTLVRPPF